MIAHALVTEVYTVLYSAHQTRLAYGMFVEGCRLFAIVYVVVRQPMRVLVAEQSAGSRAECW